MSVVGKGGLSCNERMIERGKGKEKGKSSGRRWSRGGKEQRWIKSVWAVGRRKEGGKEGEGQLDTRQEVVGEIWGEEQGV
ncbi:hypothetical protein Ancab_016453, partial [Ancistrocladus abbreviatus]